MPRLRDLLEYLARPGLEDAWLLLDIKLDNDAETIMRLIGSTVAEVQPSSKPWSERIVLGLWAAKYLPLAARYLPGFPVMHIGFHLPYASQFLTVPNVGFNMSLPMMMAPGGSRFVRECQQKHRRQLLAWTVNDRDRMEWCIRRKFDGVITDDPSLFIEACERHEEDKPEPWFPVSFKASLEIIRIYVMITTLFYLFRRPLGSKGMPPLIERIPKRA
jgi:glycerophosphoryl diester phosphodiesterase